MSFDFTQLRDFQERIVRNTKAKGFREPPSGIVDEIWDSKPLRPVRMAIFTMNLVGEVAELWEAARKKQLDLPCDKIPTLTCAAEEIADIIIRALDVAEYLGVDVVDALEKKAAFNESRPHKHGGKAL